MNADPLPLTERVRRDRQRAIDLIRSLATSKATARYIAGALDRAQVPTLAGRPGATWKHSAVQRLAAEAGIRL
jgi:hypothetical protein